MIRHTIKVGWWILLACLLLAALLTAVRLGFPLLGQYQDTLERKLSEGFGLRVDIGDLQTEWHGPFPHLSVTDLSAKLPDNLGPQLELELDNISFEINVWQSFLELAPIFQQVDASGLTIRAEQSGGYWLPDLSTANAESIELNRLAWIAKLLMAQPSLEIKDSQLDLQVENGPLRTLKLDRLLFENGSGDHQLSGNFWIPALGEDSQLSFAIRTSGQTRDLQSLILPFYLKVDRLGTEVFDIVAPPFDIPDLDTSAEIWGLISGQQLSWLGGELQVSRALLSLTEADLQLIDSGTSFQLLPTQTGYQLQLSNTRLANADERLQIPNLAFDFHLNQGQLSPSRIMSEQLDLSSLSDWLAVQPLPERFRSALLALQPRGKLENFVVDFNDADRGPRILSDLKDVQVDAWSGVPQLEGVSGLLDAELQSGSIHLDADRFSLLAPTIYEQALEFESTNGRVSWGLGESGLRVHSGELNLEFQKAAASGQFSFEIPADRETPGMLNLQIGLRNANAAMAEALTPPKLVGEKLRDWLNSAVSGGEVDQAGLIVHAPLYPLEGAPAPAVELFIDANQVDLDYFPPWPALRDIDGFVHLRDGSVSVQSESAFVRDQSVRSALISKSSAGPLQVDLNLDGNLADIDQLFRSEPLKNSVGAALSDWTIEGTHSSVLSLGIPFDEPTGPLIKVQSNVERSRFFSETQRIDLTDINGQINYDSTSGLFFDQITGRFLETPLSASAQATPGETTLTFKAEIDADKIANWAKIPFDQFVQGPANIDGKLTLCNNSNCQSSLQLESDLQNVTVNLPDYLAKAAKSSSRLSLMLSLSEAKILQLNYANRLRGRFDLSGPLRGTLFLGEGSAQLSEQSGLLIKGRVPELDFTQLLALVDSIGKGSPNTGENGQGGIAVRADLVIDEALFGGLKVTDLEADLSRLDGEWRLNLGGGVDGLIAWDDEANYRVALNKMALLPRSSIEDKTVSKIISTTPEMISRVPQIDFDVANFSWNGTDYGRWKGALRPRNDGVGLHQIIGTLPGVTFTGNADWNIGQYETSKIVLNYRGDDFGDTLESLNEGRLVETSDLNGTIGLIWAGAPWYFAKERLDGYFSFSSASGRLIESGTGSGLLRLFGILNFNSLARRLRLDFSDLLEKGIVFDQLDGEYTIQQGIVNSAKPLVMSGPSANLSATGEINLIDRTLDQELNVALPLVSNTPLAAVLLGAPQVAGALFLIDQLIGDRLQKATSISYRLAGPWSEPEAQIDPPAEN